MARPFCLFFTYSTRELSVSYQGRQNITSFVSVGSVKFCYNCDTSCIMYCRGFPEMQIFRHTRQQHGFLRKTTWYLVVFNTITTGKSPDFTSWLQILYKAPWCSKPEWFCTKTGIFKLFKEANNLFQGTNYARLCSLAGRYDNPIPSRFLALIDCFNIPAQVKTTITSLKTTNSRGIPTQKHRYGNLQ